MTVVVKTDLHTKRGSKYHRRARFLSVIPTFLRKPPSTGEELPSIHNAVGEYKREFQLGTFLRSMHNVIFLLFPLPDPGWTGRGA